MGVVAFYKSNCFCHLLEEDEKGTSRNQMWTPLSTRQGPTTAMLKGRFCLLFPRGARTPGQPAFWVECGP